MPPAFNLSQDQTLQFDLLQVNSINVGPIPSRFRPGTRRSASRHRWQKAALRCVSTSFVLAHPGFRHPYRHHPPGPQTTSTHTYRLRIVKEQAVTSPGSIDYFGKGTAKRRDYTTEPGQVNTPLRGELPKWGWFCPGQGI